MFYDLNVPWSPNDQQLPRTLAFLEELGYNVVGLNHTISGKLPARITCAIPNPLPFQERLSRRLEVRRRVTLTLTETYQNARLAEFAKAYDILAVRPIDEHTLQLACSSLDCDIISLDLTQRLPFYFRFKMLSEAVKSGKRFEICYSQGLLGDGAARRNLINNATQLIRASRGRGLLISSETKSAIGCRGPWDAINLATIWGLGQERGFEAMSKEARSVVVTAQLKRTSYRGVIDVVYGGEIPEPAKKETNACENVRSKATQSANGADGQKRKSDEISGGSSELMAKPISKREAKRRAKRARLENGQASDADTAASQRAIEDNESNAHAPVLEAASVSVSNA